MNVERIKLLILSIFIRQLFVSIHNLSCRENVEKCHSGKSAQRRTSSAPISPLCALSTCERALGYKSSAR